MGFHVSLGECTPYSTAGEQQPLRSFLGSLVCWICKGGPHFGSADMGCAQHSRR